jgi:hypothetical protein
MVEENVEACVREPYTQRGSIGAILCGPLAFSPRWLVYALTIQFSNTYIGLHKLHIDYKHVLQLFPCQVYADCEKCMLEHSGVPANDTCVVSAVYRQATHVSFPQQKG